MAKSTTTTITQKADNVSTVDASNIIHKYVLWSGGIGILPIPLLDVAGVLTLQTLMIRNLAKKHDIPFSDHLGKTALFSLLGAYSPSGLAKGLAGSLVKAIPVVGSALNVLTFPVLAGASTYAVGKTFEMHFASGGTMLNFNAGQMKDYFREQFSIGKKEAEKEQKAKPAAN